MANYKKFTETDAQVMACEKLEIKGHQCYFIEFDDNSGYSVLVFKNGHHIHYVDDFQFLHNYLVRKEGKDALRKYYIDTLSSKLFTDSELTGEVKSYQDYSKKDYFLRNYWIMRYDYISICAISEEDRKNIEKGKKTHPYFNRFCNCYVADENIVNDASRISANLEEGYKKLQDNVDEFRKMVAYELGNHEAVISNNYEDALDALGLNFEDLSKEKQKIVREELRKQVGRNL